MRYYPDNVIFSVPGYREAKYTRGGLQLFIKTPTGSMSLPRANALRKELEAKFNFAPESARPTESNKSFVNSKVSQSGKASVAPKAIVTKPKTTFINSKIPVGKLPVGLGAVRPVVSQTTSSQKEVVTASNAATGKSFVPTSVKAQASEEAAGSSMRLPSWVKPLAIAVGAGLLLKKLA